MAHEVDFLPVGTGSSSGDAIALRFGNLTGPRNEQTVVIIDGGYADDGKALVDVVRDDYGTGRVDVVIATHHDNDHLNGLSTVVSELEVGELWINVPEVSPSTAALRASVQTDDRSRRKLARVTASLTSAHNLVDTASEFGVPVKHAFAGQALVTPHGAVNILGPDEAYYSDLAENFTAVMSHTSMFSKAAEAIKTVFETLDHETLGEDSDTSASNNSSAITLVSAGDQSLLFTGDAGADALHRAADLLERHGIDITETLRLMQVPHHGSRRNSTPSMLDRFLGPKGQADSGVTAVVSCAPDGAPKHPAKKVTNAFNRRGATVAQTAGGRVLHRVGLPMRPGFVPITPVPFYSQVEEVSDKSPLDADGRRARLSPSLLALLPVAVFIFTAGLASHRALLGLLGAAAVQAGVPVLLAYMPRNGGRRVEKRLWGGAGMPTTQMLRWTGAKNPHVVASAHAGLAKLVPEVRLPTAQEEAAAPEDADMRYEAAIFSARDRLRGTPAGELIFEENCSYGFHRNLRSIRKAGRRIAASAAAASAAALLLTAGGAVEMAGWLLVGGLMAELGMLAFWNIYPTDERVVAAADDYATAFIRSLTAVTASPAVRARVAADRAGGLFRAVYNNERQRSGAGTVRRPKPRWCAHQMRADALSLSPDTFLA